MKRAAICQAVAAAVSDIAAAQQWHTRVYDNTPFDETELPAVRLLRGNSGLDGPLLAGLQKETLRLDVSLLAAGADAADQADAFEQALREALPAVAANLALGINHLSLAVSWDQDAMLEPNAAARLAIIINHIS